MKQESVKLPALGASSLLVFFGVLCLTVFAVLSITTAQAGERMSQNTQAAVAAYYEADGQANRILSRLRQGEHPENVTLDGDVYSYSCPISETQTLWVSVRITGETYEILRWQAVSTAQWEASDTLPVYTG